MRKTVDKFLEKMLLIVVGTMLVSVIWQGVTRYLLGSPSTITDEIASFSLIWLGLYGSAYATGKKLHLAIDLIPEPTVKKNPKFYIGIVTVAIVIFAIAVMVVGGAHLCWVTYKLQQQSAALKIPLFWIYSCVPFSGMLIVYYSLDTFIKESKPQKAAESGLL